MKKTTITIGLFIWLMALAIWGTAAFAEDEPIVPQNGIPVVLVKVDESGNNPSIEDMNQGPDHNTRCVGTVRIVTPEGYTSEYDGFAPTEEIQLEYIRGRGNTSWSAGKKPYKLKFAKSEDGQTAPLTGKQNLFGMGKSREWALMANAYDPTLMKNRITSWLGQEIGMPYTPQMVPVDLYMEGTNTPRTYLGSYNLSELVMIEGSRVDIDELDVDEAENVTGGYLIPVFTEFQNGDEPESTRIITNAGVELYNKEPSYDDTTGELTAGQKAQRKYITKYIQDLEDLIMTPQEDFTEEIHDQIAAKMDLESAADYWLIQEFSINRDAFGTSSTYLYKEKDGKLCWGPLWDNDYSWSNQSDDPDQSIDDVSGFSHTSMIWIDELRQKDSAFAELIQRRWREKLSPAIERLTGEKIDEYKNEVKTSQHTDYNVWGGNEESGVQTYENYDLVVEALKTFINARRDWFDNNIENVDRVFFTATYMVGDQVLGSAQVKAGGVLNTDNAPVVPDKEGYVFEDWYEKETGQKCDAYYMNADAIFVPQYVKDDNPDLPAGICFSQREVWRSIEEGETYFQYPAIYPEDAIARHVKWSVSDDSIASLNEEGQIDLHKTGDVTITGELYNGLKASYLMHVYDPKVTPKADMTGIEADKKNITMKPGQTETITYAILPKNQPVEVAFDALEISDTEVVQIEQGFAITALKPGTAIITISVTPEKKDGTGWGEPVTDTVTVTVTDDSDDPVTPDEPEKATYTIKYDLNGGTLDGQTGVITEQHKEGEVITVKDAPTRTGYKFDYWEGSKLYPGDKYTVTEDHTLKAVWSRNSGSGTGSSTTSSGKTSGTSSGSSSSKTAASAKTGDHAEFRIWYLLMILSAAIMLGLLASGKKRRA